MRLSQLLLLFSLALLTIALTPFCSVGCRSMGCAGDTYTNCNGACSTNWVPSGNSCIPNSANNYYIQSTTNDLPGGTLVVAPVNVNNGSCPPFSVYGWYTTETITVTCSTGITTPFFNLIVYFGILTGDGQHAGFWGASTNFFLAMADAGNFSSNISYGLYGSTDAAQVNYCFTNKNEHWNRISQSYAYNTTNSALTYSINNNQPNTSDLWGIKQFIIVYQGCNPICGSCYGIYTTQCYSCFTNSSVTYWLSNSTCSLNCLTQFGQTTSSNVCVYCSLLCTACFETSTNCSACTKSGTNRAFLFGSNNTCMNPCPSGYFANNTAQTCDSCNANCTTCVNSASYCTGCQIGFSFLNNFCYNPCPVGSYNNTNASTCIACSAFCQACEGPYDLCTVCTTTNPYIAYLYNTTSIAGSCDRTCPAMYYEETYNGAGPNLCLACNSSCEYCTGNPTPCTQCVAGYFLLNFTCLGSCPNTTFESSSTGVGLCLDCNVVCVSLTITMQFANSLNTQMYIDMTFSQNLNFSSFDYKNFQTITISSDNMQYTMSMFTNTTTITSGSSYRITLQPASYIFLYNATFTVTTEAQPNTTDYSLIMMPFKPQVYLMTASLNWFLIYGPPFSSLEIGVMTSFSTLSTKTNDFLTLPYVQQIKKTGIFNLLFSGAQITSCSMLSNQIQSQNLYEGVRFWGIFVFFDAPPYQQISNLTKNFVYPSVESMIRNAQAVEDDDVQNGLEVSSDYRSQERSLFSTNTMYWRFQRSGQTSFFIYDCYMPAFLIILCWISLIIAFKCKNKHWYALHAPKIFSAVHKVHEMTLIYITMASIVQFLYFQPTSFQRYLSAIICVIFNVYFVVYELYIYSDMLKYPMAEIGNRLYDYYVVRYGSFLKNIRYEEYDIHEHWSPKHWFRPYNFHFLSYYKKFIMMISLPLFYSTQYAQMGILLIVQVLELIRVWVAWPFLSETRNWIRLSLEVALTGFFLINLIQINLLVQIETGDINNMGSTIQIFYSMGWAGFLLCFYFNIMYVCIGIYDMCIGLKTSNRMKMDNARRKYYYFKIKEYEKDNEAASKDLVNRWVKLGNLNDNIYSELPEINVRIEEYTMRMSQGKFEVAIRKIYELYMMEKRNRRKKNNTVTRTKIEKKGVLMPHTHPELYAMLYRVFEDNSDHHEETIILKTFLNVFQADFSEGEEVPMNRNLMFQKVELISYDNQRQERELQEVMEGFPLPKHMFNRF